MRIIPVLDLKGGEIVHAVGGRRDEYRPIRSRLVDSSEPGVVAQTIRDRLGLREMYLADLDAIAGEPPAWHVFRSLCEMGIDLKVDIGIRDTTLPATLLETGVRGVIIGLETIAGPQTLREIVAGIGARALWFSLDLKNGEPLISGDDWPDRTPEAIVAEVVRVGIRQVIVLDLAHVGERRGTGTEELCARLLGARSGIELIVGGGVRNRADINRLEQLGVAGALVATAIHSLELP
jgi:phosphoribosylformimino-5-aminoimidazole carboxamide ribotide isomerase